VSTVTSPVRELTYILLERLIQIWRYSAMRISKISGQQVNEKAVTARGSKDSGAGNPALWCQSWMGVAEFPDALSVTPHTDGWLEQWRFTSFLELGVVSSTKSGTCVLRGGTQGFGQQFALLVVPELRRLPLMASSKSN
jgi:hypothetical protein